MRYETQQCGDGDCLTIIDNEIKDFTLSAVNQDTGCKTTHGFIPSKVACTFELCKLLNAYDSLLKLQEECGKTGHVKVLTIFNQENDCEEQVTSPFCWKCGADLTKGENHG